MTALAFGLFAWCMCFGFALGWTWRDGVWRNDDAIMVGDQEGAHSDADDILLKFVPDDVAKAWRRAEWRVGGFWYA